MGYIYIWGWRETIFVYASKSSLLNWQCIKLFRAFSSFLSGDFSFGNDIHISSLPPQLDGVMLTTQQYACMFTIVIFN